MKLMHQLNWMICISLSFWATSFTLAACSPKASTPETHKGDAVELATEGNAVADSNAKDGADAPETEAAQDADDAAKAENADDAAKAENADDAAKTQDADVAAKAEAENDNTEQAAADDDKQDRFEMIDSQPPIAKTIDDEFEFPKCMVCRYCNQEIDWDASLECRLSAGQVDRVIQKGAVNQYNEYGQTPLMLANDLESVRKLLAAGASPNHTDEFGNDAMDYAQTREIQQELIKAGYKTEPRDTLYKPESYNNRDPFFAQEIKSYKKWDKEKASKPSKKIGAYMFDKSQNGSDGDSAIGIEYRDDRIIRAWIKKGNDVNAKDEDGRTPLFYINYPKEARLLLAAGANINAQDNDGNTPLIWFMSGEPLEDEDEFGDITKEVIKVLIAAGADTTITNNDGLSAKDYKK